MPLSFDGGVPSRNAFSVSCTAFTAAAKGWWPCGVILGGESHSYGVDVTLVPVG